MSDTKHYRGKFRRKQPDSGIKLVIPFLLTLGILTVVSFIIPLRPSVSLTEKRPLAQFPEFSWSALAEGTYFDDITTWFSDTFPGRESWLELSAEISNLHGYSDVVIVGGLPEAETGPGELNVPDPTFSQDHTPQDSQPEHTPQDSQPDPTEESTPEPTGWGGVNAGEGAEIDLIGGTLIQIGDSAFNTSSYSQYYTELYARYVSEFAAKMKDQDIRVVSVPAPTAVGILVEREYLEKLKCDDQSLIIDHMHTNMTEDVIKVDTYDALVSHNSEYIYFRTDHHWTALGAYYTYAAICDSLGYEALPLEDFREWSQGDFLGSLYYHVPKRKNLRTDELIIYVPPMEVKMEIFNNSTYGFEAEMLRDATGWPENTKYSAFLFADNPMAVLTNDSLPDGPSCIFVKDSFGNSLAPYLSQNYHKVYAIDYRQYNFSTISWFLQRYEIDDIILSPYITATQSQAGCAQFRKLLQ